MNAELIKIGVEVNFLIKQVVYHYRSYTYSKFCFKNSKRKICAIHNLAYLECYKYWKSINNSNYANIHYIVKTLWELDECNHFIIYGSLCILSCINMMFKTFIR